MVKVFRSEDLPTSENKKYVFHTAQGYPVPAEDVVTFDRDYQTFKESWEAYKKRKAKK